MKRQLVIISLSMLFLVGFIPSNGASRVLHLSQVPPNESSGQSSGSGFGSDSLPIRRSVELTTDGQKRLLIYNDVKGGDSLFRLSIAEDSTYAPAYYAMSQLFAATRSPLDSVLYYVERAYLLDTLNKWYSDLYAQSLAMKGDFNKAQGLYLKAIEREPQALQYYVMAAMLYRQISEPALALSVLDSAELRTGKNSYLSSLKRELLIASGRHEEAIEEAIELTEIDPQDVENYLALADLYNSTKQDSLAQKAYEGALRADSTSLVVINTLSAFYADRGDMAQYFAMIKLLFRSDEESIDRKIATFKRFTIDNSFYAKNFFSINELAIQLYLLEPTNKDIVELYAKHLIASGSLDKALELYKKHTSDSPVQYDYYTSIIDIESYLQHVDSVELYAARAIELFPDRHELKLSQANLYSYTKRYDEAIKRYKEVIDAVPSDSLKGVVWGRIGDIFHQQSLERREGSARAKSLMRKAYKSYEKSLAIYGANAMVLNNYAYFLSLDKRELKLALDMSGRAIAIEPNNPTYLDTYAWVLFELGRLDEAKKIMRQVIALDTTNSADIQFHYAEILAALGESFMAEVYYDKAAKLGYDLQIILKQKEKLK